MMSKRNSGHAAGRNARSSRPATEDRSAARAVSRPSLQARKRRKTSAAKSVKDARGPAPAAGKGSIRVRRVTAADVPQIVQLDQEITGVGKAEYWRDIYARYGKRRLAERFFFVAEPADERSGRRILGFVIGEIRAWEFGSAPCGWVFAMSVDPGTRLQGIGTSLLEAIADEFRKAGVAKMRTMVARDNRLHLLFFRSQEMTAGPYIQLEKELD